MWYLMESFQTAFLVPTVISLVLCDGLSMDGDRHQFLIMQWELNSLTTCWRCQPCGVPFYTHWHIICNILINWYIVYNILMHYSTMSFIHNFSFLINLFIHLSFHWNYLCLELYFRLHVWWPFNINKEVSCAHA